MIEFRDVTKRYVRDRGLKTLLGLRPRRYLTALDHFDFSCGRGEILGVVGPNGAGKTTLSKLVANLILPDEGEIRIAGSRLSDAGHALRRHIGYVTCDERSFFWRLTGRQNLRFFLSLCDRHSDEAALRLARYFDLESKLDVPFGEYSTGMRKRLAIIRGMMTDPAILIFDEATNALDPVSVTKLETLLAETCADKTVIWTTHRLEEIAKLCTQVLVIREGRLLFQGAIDELKRRYRWSARRVSVTARGDRERIAALARESFEVAETSQRDSLCRFTVIDDGKGGLFERLTALLERSRAELVRFEEVDVSMNEIYLSLVEPGSPELGLRVERAS